jgi:hypothetical protein
MTAAEGGSPLAREDFLKIGATGLKDSRAEAKGKFPLLAVLRNFVDGHAISLAICRNNTGQNLPFAEF